MQRRTAVAGLICSPTAVPKSNWPADFAMFAKTACVGKSPRALKPFPCHNWNEDYARANRSFGLTTMRDRHVESAGTTLRFHFGGKSGKEHTVEINDRRLARIVKGCQDIPGQEWFQYRDDEDQRRIIDSADVNEYLRQITGQDFSSKDFQPWAGTVLAIQALQVCGSGESATQAKKAVVQAIKTVAAQLGNTPAVCRKCYVHPAVIEAYLEGSLLQMLQALAEQNTTPALNGLSPEEGLPLPADGDENMLRSYQGAERCASRSQRPPSQCPIFPPPPTAGVFR